MIFEASSIKQKQQEPKNPPTKSEISRSAQRSSVSSTSTKTHSISFAAVVAGKHNESQAPYTDKEIEHPIIEKQCVPEQPINEQFEQLQIQQIPESDESIRDKFQQKSAQKISEEVIEYLNEQINLEPAPLQCILF